jgi:hypothetical protein
MTGSISSDSEDHLGLISRILAVLLGKGVYGHARKQTGAILLTVAMKAEIFVDSYIGHIQESASLAAFPLPDLMLSGRC